MRRLLVVVACLSASALLSGGACEPPAKDKPDPNDPNDPNQPNGPPTCTVNGQELPLPDEAAVRPNGGVLNLGCIGAPDGLAQSAAVRLQGCIDVFGLGGRAKAGIRVALFDDSQDPRSDVPAHGEVEIAVSGDAAGLDCADADASSAACLSVGCDKEGAYVMENIPVHVPLIMRVHKPGDDTVIETYTFGVVFDHGQAPAVDGVVDYEANVIYRSTYDSIPVVGGRIVDGQQVIGDGVGRGVIAGEVHDCDDQIIRGATVTTDRKDASTKVTYFNGDIEDPEPAQARLSTNTDGLYVILNVTTDAGTEVHQVSAAILDPTCAAGEDCQCSSLSSRTVKAYPDSVSIVTLRGDLPTLN